MADAGLMEGVWGTWLTYMLSVLCYRASEAPCREAGLSGS